jgi:outer membrane receptor protein involved in Fe transport
MLLRNWVLLTLFVCSAGFLPAQDIAGAIAGTVTDASGAGIAGAKVAIFSVDRQHEDRTVTTENSGNYVVSELQPGRYNVTVEAKGFKRSALRDIVLNVNDRFTANAALEVGDVSQTVNVAESQVQVQLQSSEQSTVVNGTQIRELALVTRNYEQLVALMPGVTSASVDQLYVGVTLPSGATATIPFSINGARNSSSSWLVDGADNVDRGSNLTLLNTPSIDAIAEFKVLRSNYPAELGRAGGGQISVITKSGTNELHGNLYEFVRNNAFAANNFYNNATGVNPGANGAAQVAPLHYNNFGGTVGGPVFIPKIYNGKNKTFFFFSEEVRRVITYASGTATLPTAAEITGVFPHAVCTQYTGNTCAQTATQITNIDPISRQYIKDIYSKLPLGASTSVNSLFRNVYNFHQELYKVDHSIGEKFRFSVRYLQDTIPTVEPQGLFTGSPVPGVAITDTNAPGHNWTVNANWTITPTWTNETGFNYSYGAITSDPVGLINSTISTDIKTTLPFTSTLAQVPGLAFTGGTSITGYGPYRDFNRNYNIFDNMGKVFGNHSVRGGVTYNYYQKTENAGGANAGSFTFTPATVPAGGATTFDQSFANFLTGNVASFSQASIDVTPDIRAQQFELYVQDDWKVKSNLTLNVGVRYSNFRQPIDKKGELTNFDPALYSAANAPAITATGLLATANANTYLNGIITAGKNSPFGNKVSNQDNGNFGPRFGFAWDPFKTGKTAIRGGYGVFFDPTLYGTFEQNIFANPPFVNSATIVTTTLDNPAGGTQTVANSPKVLHATPVDFKTPYTQQWNLEIQRQITKTATLSVAYVGTKATHLLGIVDLNAVQPGLAYSSGLVPTTTNFTAANEAVLNLLRPYQGYNAIGALESWFNSNYHALQATGQKRFAGDSQVGFSYTFSKNLTDAQTDRSSAPQNVYNIHEGEYGPGSLDRHHVFSLNFVYTLPFYTNQNGLTGKALGGWQVSGIASYYTGLPFTVTTTGTDPAGLGIIGSSPASLRPDLVCNPNNGPQTRAQWFNTACFAQVPAGVHLPGNEGRGVVRGPGYEGWSLSASKNLRWGADQRYRFQLRGEASNALNHTNPSSFGSLSTTSTLFGTVTGYRDPRIIQLGGKLYF